MIDYRVGDVRDVMAGIPDGTVSLVASSPPFLALRSYLPAGHDAKHAEIGSEPDPATFLDTLLALTAEWGRVLAPWGSIAIELGDTYSGGGGGGGDFIDGSGQFSNPARLAKAVNGNYQRRSGSQWPRAKCLALIPQLYATSLAYGRNILTGAESPAGQWLVRNVIVWHRPNPAVGALGDKYRPSTSYITVATRSSKRWFDLTAVRTPYMESTLKQHRGGDTINGEKLGYAAAFPMAKLTQSGAPPLDTWFDHHDTWTLTTQPSSLAHYAMWPAKLAERLILAMCPPEVCAVCGEPRRRMEGPAEYVKPNGHAHGGNPEWRGGRDGLAEVGHIVKSSITRQSPTLGWSDCGHDAFIPGTVLDPFAGTGTTLAVADLHGRDAIGIDIDTRNRDLYPARYDEVKKALYGTPAPMPGQLVMVL